MPKKIQFALLNMHLLAAYIIITPPPILSMQFIDTNMIHDASNDYIILYLLSNKPQCCNSVQACPTLWNRCSCEYKCWLNSDNHKQFFLSWSIGKEEKSGMKVMPRTLRSTVVRKLIRKMEHRWRINYISAEKACQKLQSNSTETRHTPKFH